jgi:hypothetical protein
VHVHHVEPQHLARQRPVGDAFDNLLAIGMVCVAIVDVPSGAGDKHTAPGDVRAAVKAALGAGADGIVWAREYHEMWLANLTAGGETVREAFSRKT